MLEKCVKDAFNQLLETVFKESLLEQPVYSSYVEPIEQSLRDYTVFAQIKFERWLIHRFKVGGLSSEIYGFHEGFTEGRNYDKAIYVRTQMGSIFDFAVPQGFVIANGGRMKLLRNSEERSRNNATYPLIELVKTDLEHSNSRFNRILSTLPKRTKYAVSGLFSNEYKFQKKPLIAVIPRQGKTIVGVVFLSHLPYSKKTKGRKIRDGQQEYEVGIPYGANLANAYHLIRYFQDIPDLCKINAKPTAELLRIEDFEGKNWGSLFDFLALEIARNQYSPDMSTFSLKAFLTKSKDVQNVVSQFNDDFPDITLGEWGS